ncbi:hypothetical protein [Streptomyces sp. RP5T]|uniref:hypothetical protein n=1 Tax=Streptomyces sp. RP5T TaxID=2490848 RepID=UPI000F649E61|nr:hypothetical protein [Streptomyces sp. RP5T]RRR75872.1 hypothetical protein EHS43_31905 [Streptomyces sp. RP5T]
MNGEHTALHDRLDTAFRQAGVEANVQAGPAQVAVSVTLYSRLPAFAHTAEAATAWMCDNGIDGEARLDPETFHIVIALRTEPAVDRFTDLLLTPHIQTRTAAISLAEALGAHTLFTSVHTDLATHTIKVELNDNADVLTAVTVAGLLGAPGLDRGLDLTRTKQLHRLAERLSWLVTGVTGSFAYAETVPGCAHDPDQITLILNSDQVLRLVDRIRTGPLSEIRT